MGQGRGKWGLRAITSNGRYESVRTETANTSVVEELL